MLKVGHLRNTNRHHKYCQQKYQSFLRYLIINQHSDYSSKERSQHHLLSQLFQQEFRKRQKIKQASNLFQDQVKNQLILYQIEDGYKGQELSKQDHHFSKEQSCINLYLCIQLYQLVANLYRTMCAIKLHHKCEHKFDGSQVCRFCQLEQVSMQVSQCEHQQPQSQHQKR
ncbi:hypothetical protein TTHERM_000355369 (macronuclear) [Tetrahymena thermophila SB210]|uniref:Uncharacterized protein n=1 Tax=Tetrahymena thermophila (strain SB210) TaxID=312017 RepID=W7XCS2_TETTS|nr:hypothetical protein TTHERM_000355369 [Tetrahymena thermophila SB210]EWS75282.1 hypothetical protein TTHERM_000355369 [Tetrahymena thermophila SB210]|eukprot:XP_012652273.1 hypothetical protein TTHERM_000355369 [Tetrahymena thermophila SB210]